VNRHLIAILRGVKPDEVIDIATVLIEAGITTLEVPLNSPEPIESIRRLVDRFGSATLIGGGTVLTCADVEAVAAVGGRLIVSPNCDPQVIETSCSHAMLSYPGVMTATECFTALQHGADGLKFFPSFQLGPEGLSALLAVLPSGTKTYAVGGVGPENFQDWLAAGVTGFGIGSALYRVGWTADDVSRQAKKIVAAFDEHTAQLCLP
jgi:2-dehydro-3-deoxyphosphogalactonate aldolase